MYLRSTNADKKTIEKMHRKLMIFNHPDRGGSPYLATKVIIFPYPTTQGAGFQPSLHRLDTQKQTCSAGQCSRCAPGRKKTSNRNPNPPIHPRTWNMIACVAG